MPLEFTGPVGQRGRAKATLARERLMQEARAARHTAPSVLTQQTLGRVDSETLARMPSERSLKRKIQRIRREDQPALPATFQDVILDTSNI